MSDEGGVAAVDRALSILDALTGDKVTLAGAGRSGPTLCKSTVLRLLKSLEKFGQRPCAALTARTGSAPKVLHLGLLYQRHFKTSEIVPPVLRSVPAPRSTKARRSMSARKTAVCLAPASRRAAPCAHSIHIGDRAAADGGCGRSRAARLH